MARVHETSPEEATEKAKAVVRRLQAALAPSLFTGRRPSDEMIAAELKAMLESEGVHHLLSYAPRSQFTDVIERAHRVVQDGASSAETINTLWNFVDGEDLNAALKTDAKEEQPTELVRLMLEGPYKHALAQR